MKQYFSVLPDARVGEISIFFYLFFKDKASSFPFFNMEIFESKTHKFDRMHMKRRWGGVLSA